MTTTLTITDILDTILAGNVDDNLDAIREAVADRVKMQGRSKFLTCKVGDTGRLVNVRPRYLNGAPFTVTDKRQTKITVRLDEAWLNRNPQARARWSGNVVCPPQMLELD